MSREVYRQEMTFKEDVKTKRKNRLPAVVFGVVLLAILAGLIAVAVLYVESLTKIRRLEAQLVVTGETATTVVPTVGVPTRDPIWRISKSVDVSHYKLDLNVHLPFDQSEETAAGAFTTSGTVEIHLRPIGKSIKEIQFHARTDPKKSSGYLKFEAKDVVLLKNDTKVDGIVVEFVPDQDVVIITTKDALEEPPSSDADNYKIRITFDGTISADNDNQGLYRSSYEITVGGNNTKRYAAATQFQPYKARRVFPCFDEPGFRSTFEISIAHDARFTVVRSNGVASLDAVNKPQSVNGKEWARTKFTTTPKMSAYLVAFFIASSDFSYQVIIPKPDVNPEQKNFGVIVRKSLDSTASFALKQGVAMTEYLSSDTFGQKLYDHLQKIDMVAVPDFSAGAMENWGLITYRESSMLYDEKINGANAKMNVANIVAHELAHFLFGNLVTCEFWDDTWLNEGFASFYSYQLVKHTKPQWNIDTLIPYWVTQAAFKLDSYDTAHPLYEPMTKTLEQIDNMFDSTTYSKGGAVLQMIKGILGEAKFDAAIKSYLAANKLSNVKHPLLLAEFAKDDDKLESNLQPWITEAGYPVLILTKQGTTINYSQSRFLFSISDTQEKVWPIPLTLRSKASNETDFGKTGCWLGLSTGDLTTTCPNLNLTEIASSGDYYVANIDQKGYYRVSYDVENWNRIATSLHEDDFGGLNSVTRSQLLNDAFNLAKTDRFTTKYNTALELTKYLSKETQFSPLAAGLDALRFIDQMMWSSPQARESMRVYMEACATGAYAPSSWDQTFVDDADKSNFDEIMYRSNLVESACYYGNTDCLSQAQTLLVAWITGSAFTGNHTLATNNYLSTMLCYAVRGTAASANWNSLRQLLTPELSTSNKLILLRALACSSEQSHLTSILELTLDPKYIRAQDMETVVSSVTKFPEGLERAWNFVQINWEVLQRRSGMISNFGSKFSSPQQLKELKRFYERRNGAGGAFPEKITFQKAIAEAESNVDWVTKHQGTVVRFFENSIDCKVGPNISPL